MAENKEESMDDNKEADGQQENITITSIYNSIRKLSTEEQVLILANYKIGELYKLYNNEAEFNKYQKNLIDTSKLYVQTVDALSKHRAEAVKENGTKWESDMVCAMEEAYDNMTEWGQEKFCQEMAGREGFFKNMYRIIMKTLNNALKEHKT